MTKKELEKRVDDLEDLNKILWGLFKKPNPNDDGGNMAPLYPYQPPPVYPGVGQEPQYPGVGFEPWGAPIAWC